MLVVQTVLACIVFRVAVDCCIVFLGKVLEGVGYTTALQVNILPKISNILDDSTISLSS